MLRYSHKYDINIGINVENNINASGFLHYFSLGSNIQIEGEVIEVHIIKLLGLTLISRPHMWEKGQYTS